MNYLKGVLKVGKAVVESGNLKTHCVAVFHDDWCGVFKGKGCDCNPEIKDVTQNHEKDIEA